jgi:hypothetical protein
MLFGGTIRFLAGCLVERDRRGEATSVVLANPGAARRASDRPGWIGLVDFAGLKIKLLSPVVAISAIPLLRTFRDVSEIPKAGVAWQLAIDLDVVISGLLLAFMDRLSGAAHPRTPEEDRRHLPAPAADHGDIIEAADAPSRRPRSSQPAAEYDAEPDHGRLPRRKGALRDRGG